MTDASSDLLALLRTCMTGSIVSESERHDVARALTGHAALSGVDDRTRSALQAVADAVVGHGDTTGVARLAATAMRYVMSTPDRQPSGVAVGSMAAPAELTANQKRRVRRDAAIGKRQQDDERADRAGTKVGLARPIETLAGVGEATGRLLRGKGIETVGDLLWVLPRRYDDESVLTPIADLVTGERQVTVGVVASARLIPRGARQRMAEVMLETPSTTDGGGARLRLLWFRAPPGLLNRFATRAMFRVAGVPEDYRGVMTVTHPETARVDGDGGVLLRGIVPRYPEIAGIAPAKLAALVARAVDAAVALATDVVPQTIREVEGLLSIRETLRALHAPPSEMSPQVRETWNAHRSVHHLRLAYEEFFMLEIALHRRRAVETGVTAEALSAPGWDLSRASSVLPYALTGAQRRVVEEVTSAMSTARPMRRLLQGDVGSGKTAVAIMACAFASSAGAQAAVMAPTEILAEQHFRSMAPLAERLRLRVALVLGGARASHRRKTAEGLAAGTIDLAIGTQALLAEGVHFARLRLVIIDEQHRFGVNQRLQLVGKAANADAASVAPHLLVMTATPIPRTLTLALHGDLDTSVLDEMPPGRLPPVTRAFSHARREVALGLVEKALAAGGQAYVVCPTIDDSETMDLRSLAQTHQELSERFGRWGVELLHSRLPAEQKVRAMDRFSAGVVKVLVATTMIEVGVDVPAANVILIDHAERFGLAQLHQLRGRVGRGGQRSGCLLVHQATGEDALCRMRVMCETTDGFEIAEHDLALRGPGELFGRKQSGLPGFRFGDLRRDVDLLERARSAAREVIDADPELRARDHEALRDALDRRERGANAVVKEEAG